MPNYKKHLAFGFLLYLISIYLMSILNKSISFNLANYIEWLCCILFGSLFPDIDTKSKIKKKLYIFLLLLNLILIFLGEFTTVAILSVFSLVPLTVHHRALFHKPIFILGLGLSLIIYIKLYQPYFYINTIYNILFFILGAFSHIYLDMGKKQFFKI